MTQATIRTAVYNAVNGVSDVGMVYNREKYSDDWLVFLSQFKTSIGGINQIRGWMIGFSGYATAPEKEFAGPPGGTTKAVIRRAHIFKAMGYQGYSDELDTERTFAALAESVVNALDADTTLHGGSFFSCSPASIDFYGTLLKADVFCNHAEITIVVTEALEI